MAKIIKSIAILPNIWKLAEQVAKLENRSISSLIECLIVEEAEKKGINPYNFER